MNRQLFGLVVLILFVLFGRHMNAQRSNASVGLLPVYKVNGYGANANFNYYPNSTNYLQISLVATFSEKQPNSAIRFPFEDYLFNLGYFTTVLTSPRRGISIYFGGGPSAGYQIVDNSQAAEDFFDIEPVANAFIYGAYASFDMDFYLTDSLSLTIPISGIYHFNSEIEEVKLLLGAGIRYYF